MRRRRRPLRALLLLAALSGAAFYVLEASLQAEREYGAFVHQLASGQESRVLESHFERGWLRSRANTSLEVAGGAGLVFRSAVEALGARDVRSRVGVTIVNEIEHGLLPLVEWARAGFQGTPILAHIRSTIEIDQESQFALAEAIGKLPPLEAHTVLRTAGQAATRFTIRGEHLKSRGEGFEREGRWLGLDGDIDFSHGFRRIHGRVRSAGLESTGPERVMAFRELDWEFDLPAGELPVGRMTLSLAGLEADSANAGAVPLKVERLRIEGDSRLSGGSFGAQLSVSAAAVSLGEERWGPGTLRLALNDVDGEALRRLRRAGLRLESHRHTGDPAQIAVVAADVLEALPSLLSRGPHLTVEQLELATPHGAVTGAARFALAAGGEGEGAHSVGSLLRGELDMRLPARVLDVAADARVRGELADEGVDPTDEAAFGAKVRERKEAWIAGLRRVGRLSEEGSSLLVHTSWPAPPPHPAAAPLARGAARAPARPAELPQPPPAGADAEPAPPPAAPAPTPEAPAGG